MKTTFRISGDCSVLAVYGAGVDPAVNEKVRRMTALLNSDLPGGIVGIVGSYCTLAVRYDPLQLDFRQVTSLLLEREKELGRAIVAEARVVAIPVCYGDEFGPDLDFVAEHNGLDREEVITLHSEGLYRIYAIGFAPGFCYLGGLHRKLHCPRLESPRQKVLAGSVGIAGSQTGVYPQDSPGGWRLIGRTPLRLFAPERQEPLLYGPGDSIRFQPISLEEFHARQQEDSL